MTKFERGMTLKDLRIMRQKNIAPNVPETAKVFIKGDICSLPKAIKNSKDTATDSACAKEQYKDFSYDLSCNDEQLLFCQKKLLLSSYKYKIIDMKVDMTWYNYNGEVIIFPPRNIKKARVQKQSLIPMRKASDQFVKTLQRSTSNYYRDMCLSVDAITIGMKMKGEHSIYFMKKCFSGKLDTCVSLEVLRICRELFSSEIFSYLTIDREMKNSLTLIQGNLYFISKSIIPSDIYQYNQAQRKVTPIFDKLIITPEHVIMLFARLAIYDYDSTPRNVIQYNTVDNIKTCHIDFGRGLESNPRLTSHEIDLIYPEITIQNVLYSLLMSKQIKIVKTVEDCRRIPNYYTDVLCSHDADALEEYLKNLPALVKRVINFDIVEFVHTESYIRRILHFVQQDNMMSQLAVDPRVAKDNYATHIKNIQDILCGNILKYNIRFMRLLYVLCFAHQARFLVKTYNEYYSMSLDEEACYMISKKFNEIKMVDKLTYMLEQCNKTWIEYFPQEEVEKWMQPKKKLVVHDLVCTQDTKSGAQDISLLQSEESDETKKEENIEHESQRDSHASESNEDNIILPNMQKVSLCEKTLPNQEVVEVSKQQ